MKSKLMKPLFVAAVIGSALIAGGVLMAGDFKAALVASPRSADASAIPLAAGFYGAYRKPKAAACEGDGDCGTPISGRINKVVLWGSTVLVLAALAFPYYAPLLLDS